MSNFCASDASIENKRFICEKTCNLCSRNQYTDPLSSLELHDDHLPIQRRSAEQKCHDTKGIYYCTFYKNAYRKCSTNPEEMNADCALSCDKCSPSVPHPGTDVCVDYLDMLGLEGYGNQTCVNWMAAGGCTDHWYKNESNYYCKKSCGLCNQNRGQLYKF